MKSKIVVSFLIILLLLGIGLSYATENTNVAENLTVLEKPVVEELLNGNSVEDSNYVIPEEWARNTENNAILSDVFKSDEKVELNSETIDGNVFLSGKDITVTDVSITGDLFVAGQDITVSNSTVFGNIFVAGANIKLNGTGVSGNIFAAAETIEINETVINDLFAAGKKVTLDGGTQVVRNVNVGSAELKMNKVTIQRNANLSAEDITIGPDAQIMGMLNYYSGKEGNISKDSAIGNIKYNQIEDEVIVEDTKEIVKDKLYTVAVIFIKAVFVCGFIYLFAKGFVEKQKVENVAGHIGISVAKGLLLAILIPIIAILLMCTGYAVGLAFVILAIYFCIFAVSSSLVAISISTALIQNKNLNAWQCYGITLVIAITIGILKIIPVIGGFITILVGLSGMGLIFSGIKNKKIAKKEEEVEQ